MRIFFFIQDMSLTGGTEKVCQNLSKLFVSKGHEVTIVSYNRGRVIEAYKPIDAVFVHYLSNQRYPIDNGVFARVKSILKSVHQIKAYYKNAGIREDDILISQNFFSSLIIWLAGKSKNVIACEHFMYEKYPKMVRAIRLIVYRSFKQIVTLTNKDKSRFLAHLPEYKLHTIPNMAIVNGEIQLNMNSKNIIAIGRLHPGKGFDMLITAMSEVSKKHPDWILNIFGEGEIKEELEKQIANYGLQRVVFLKGFSNNIRDEFEKSSIFVLSSKYEAYPMGLLEALCLGVPSVAFDCPEGPSELLATGGGILVEKENVGKLSDAIIYMIEHPEFREECMKHKEYIREQLSPEVIYGKWMELFNI